MIGALRRSLNLREGEDRLLLALGGFLFLTTAAETFLSAAKNSLFLDVFRPGLIPHVMVAAALFTALLTVALGGVLQSLPRRLLAILITVTFGVSLVVAFGAFRLEPRSAFAIYLWASAVQILLLTHAWDYIGDLLTGRQAKRLVPLIGGGGSLAAVVSGFLVAPLAFLLGSESLLWLAAVVIGLALGFLWMVREPERGEEEPEDREAQGGGARGFLQRAGRGFRALGSHPLLRLLAVAIVLLVTTAALIDFQFKIAVKAAFDRDTIAVAYGVLEATAGIGALILQVVASRYLFPRLGISASAMLHAGSLGSVAAAAAVAGTFWITATLRFLDEVLRTSIEKAIEQVTLLPFPSRIKNAAFTTLDGVLRPLATAAGGLLALLLLTRPQAVAWLTVALAGGAFLVLTRHRSRYLEALAAALSKHQVDFRTMGAEALVVDRTALDAIEEGLEDDDPTVVVFALSLLQDVPALEAAPRILPLIEHPVAEVRAEAATVLGRLAQDPRRTVRPVLVDRLSEEEDPRVLARILHALGTLGHEDPTYHLRRFVDHPDATVRRAALETLARYEPDAVRERLEILLHRGDADDQRVALAVMGALRDERFVQAITSAVTRDAVRSAALDALASFGTAALPALDTLLVRDDLPLSVKRRLVTLLAGIEDEGAQGRLLQLVTHPKLGPAALTSLKRLRAAGSMDTVAVHAFRPLLRTEVTRGARYALLASAVEGVRGNGESADNLEAIGFVVSEMHELRIRHTHRVLSVLTLAYDPDTLATVQSSLFSTDPARRSNALEYLEGTLEPEDANLAVPLAEYDPGEPTDALESLVGDSSRIAERPLEVLDAEDEWWPRALAAFAEGRQVPPRGPASTRRTSHDSDEDKAMIPLIEKVMLLKGSDLFSNFPGEELAGIAELTTAVHCEPGEVVFEQGDQGDAYYLVVRGGIRIIRDGHELALLGPREGFGEMAILDQETRSATARAAEPTALLRIDRDSFDQLVERNPAVARGIYRVLTQRLRATLARVAAGT